MASTNSSGTRPRSSSFPAALSDAYASKGTRDLGSADTGQAWWTLGNPSAAQLSVIGGKLTNSVVAPGVAAGYVVTRVGDRVLRIGGSFTLSPRAAPGNGCAAFVVWTSLMQSINSIPNAGIHLTVTSTNWSVAHIDAGVQTVYGAGSFSPPLETDGATVHTVDCAISGSTITLSLPRNSPGPITDSSIAALAGPYACFEVYQGDASTETKAAFVEVHAHA